MIRYHNGILYSNKEDILGETISKVERLFQWSFELRHSHAIRHAGDAPQGR